MATEQEIEQICIKAIPSTECPLQQKNVVIRRAWLKKQILEIQNNLLPKAETPKREYY